MIREEEKIIKARRVLTIAMKIIGFTVTGVFGYVTYIFYNLPGAEPLAYIMGAATFITLILTLAIKERR